MAERSDAPLEVVHPEHFVERNYREGGRYQWVREVLVNAIEAGAARVEYGTEWQGVDHGVYRRLVADDGSGMTPDELVAFFRTYGGSGKPIGGVHENYGIGAKCSLFPWNTAGVVVVSWHPDFADPSMIWVRKNPATGTYGLRTWEAESGGENVVAAGWDDELEIDWSLVRPDWIEDHGTVVVLLGADLSQDTVVGDPARDEGGTPGLGIVEYLNKRMWDLDGIEVRVDEYRGAERGAWPLSAGTTGLDGELQLGRRRVEGAKYYVEYPPGQKGDRGRIAASGTVDLDDGTAIDWYLWDGDGRDGIRNAAKNGYLAAQYAPLDGRTAPELFDVTDHSSRFRQFGISESQVWRRVWLIARPPLVLGHDAGVYMSSDRNRLLVQGGTKAGAPLPWDDWAIEFADSLPPAIVDAIKKARAGVTDTDFDEEWRDRLSERFGTRWKQIRFVASDDGEARTTVSEPGGAPGAGRKRVPRRKTTSGTTGGSAGPQVLGRDEQGGDVPARPRRAAVGVPDVTWESDPELFEPGAIAAWNPPSPASPSGLVQLNVGHPIMVEEFDYWESKYPPHVADQVRDVVKDAYAQMAAATVAHSESLRPHLERSEVLEKELRSPMGLTAALLGLVGANALIGQRIGGVVGMKARSA